MGKIKDQLEALMDATGKQASNTAEKMEELQAAADEIAKIKAKENKIAVSENPFAMLQELESIAQLTSVKATNAEEGYEKLTEQLMLDPAELKGIPTGPHRTLVIVEASANSSDAFKERAKRFVSGSFNTSDAMKAQIVTITDGKIYAGLVFTGEKSGGLDNSSPLVYDFVVRVSDQEWN